MQTPYPPGIKPECILIISFSEWIKGTDENYIACVQCRIGKSFFYQVQIYHTLIVTAPFRQLADILLIAFLLHFRIVDGTPIILHIYVQPDALSLIGDVDRFLRFRVVNVLNLDSQEDFQ